MKIPLFNFFTAKISRATIFSLPFLFLALVCLLPACRTAAPGDLVDVQKIIPGIVLDSRYATTNNFTGQKLYPVARCCLRREAALNLKAVQQELHGMGLGLKVFDGYRP